MSKRNKKRQRQEAAQEAAEETEMVQCPTCDAIIEKGLPECPKCGQEFVVEEAPGEEQPLEQEDVLGDGGSVEEDVKHFEETAVAEARSADPIEEVVPEEQECVEEITTPVNDTAPQVVDDPYDDEADPDEEIPQIKKTLLWAGLIFALLGTLGIVGLRLGIVQAMFGYSAAPGIGGQETLGLIVSSAPLTIGLGIIGLWGVRNERVFQKIYGELEEQEIAEEFDDIEAEEEFETIEEVEEETEAYVETQESTPVVDTLEDDMDDLIEAVSIPEEDNSGNFLEEISELETELAADGIFMDEDREETSPVGEEGPMITGSDLKHLLAEEMRMDRCKKILSTVVVLPDDKEKLKMLISSGISPGNFSDEVNKAVERRRKKEKDREVTADEKASILEDELVAELAELEENLDKKDDEDEEDLEDQILKEIEDLEDL
jgi:hypothetical protein